MPITYRFIPLLLLTLITITSAAQRKLYYLHEADSLADSPALNQILANPYDIPVLTINCQQKHCQKYKAPAKYPQLVFWNGPGCSYKTMAEPSLAALHQHFEKVNSNPIKPLRDFLERISLTEAFGVAFAFGTFLYVVFSALFKDRSQEKKAKPQ